MDDDSAVAAITVDQDLELVDAPPSDTGLEYVRRTYGSIRDWYDVSERKAQLILAANGAFISLTLGVMLGSAGDLASVNLVHLGIETWALLGLAFAAIAAAVSCAALAMWSLHGKPSQRELESLEVDPARPETYRPEALWYYGHFALLKDSDEVRRRLGAADAGFEVDVLSYHIVSLSKRVLRKHRYVNAGWGLTALALLLLLGSCVSLFIRSLV